MAPRGLGGGPPKAAVGDFREATLPRMGDTGARRPGGSGRGGRRGAATPLIVWPYGVRGCAPPSRPAPRPLRTEVPRSECTGPPAAPPAALPAPLGPADRLGRRRPGAA